MKLQRVSQNIAEELISYGFPVNENTCPLVDEPHRNGVKIPVSDDCFVYKNYYIRECPYAELVLTWFETEHKTLIYATPDFDRETATHCGWIANIVTSCSKNGPDGIFKSGFSSKEEAISAAISEALNCIS